MKNTGKLLFFPTLWNLPWDLSLWMWYVARFLRAGKLSLSFSVEGESESERELHAWATNTWEIFEKKKEENVNFLFSFLEKETESVVRQKEKERWSVNSSWRSGGAGIFRRRQDLNFFFPSCSFFLLFLPLFLGALSFALKFFFFLAFVVSLNLGSWEKGVYFLLWVHLLGGWIEILVCFRWLYDLFYT